MSEHISKDELLAKIETAREPLEYGLRDLTEAQLTQAGAIGEWSVRDLLTHIVFWEQYMLNAFATGYRMNNLEGESDDELYLRVNGEEVSKTRDKSLSRVLQEFTESYQAVLKHINTLSDEDINDPQRYVWMNGNASWTFILSDTQTHYEQHAQDLEAWHEKLKLQA